MFAKKKELDTDAITRLANGIVVQAADDYRRALKVLKIQPRDYRTRLTWERALADKQEVERFFRSQWYQMLSSIDGEYMIRRLCNELKFKMEDEDMDSMYHACRWCRNYEKGKCMCDKIDEPESTAVDYVFDVAESGQLSEVLEESLHSADQQAFKDTLRVKLIDWKISGKHITEFTELFDECMMEFLDTKCKPLCDENVSRLYQHMPEPESKGAIIKDPEEFCCKYFE